MPAALLMPRCQARCPHLAATPEEFYTYEIAKGEELTMKISPKSLRRDDLRHQNKLAQLRRTQDWVAFEATSPNPPHVIMGADGDGVRGAALSWDSEYGAWRMVAGLSLPRATLIVAEEGVEVNDAGQVEAYIRVLAILGCLPY